MEGFSEKINVHYVDKEINEWLAGLKAAEVPYPRCYSQNEEFFLRLDRKFTVPHFPIHHDINTLQPDKKYRAAVRKFLEQIIEITPGLFDDLTYYFDPEEIHKLKFIKLYKVEHLNYLYLLKIDLLFKNQYAQITKRGTNDLTAEYESDALFLEASFIPVQKETVANTNREFFSIIQAVSETWIGERGRGYFIQGIWMDDDLTRFFTKLFLAENRKIYPYYPFVCKHKTICLTPLHFSSQKRREQLPYLHRAIGFLLPNMTAIQKALRHQSFSEDLKLFRTLKKKIPDYWQEAWKNIHSEVYLNENQMREFKIEF